MPFVRSQGWGKAFVDFHKNSLCLHTREGRIWHPKAWLPVYALSAAVCYQSWWPFDIAILVNKASFQHVKCFLLHKFQYKLENVEKVLMNSKAVSIWSREYYKILCQLLIIETHTHTHTHKDLSSSSLSSLRHMHSHVWLRKTWMLSKYSANRWKKIF